MKKTFPLHLPGKADQRVVEAIKHDVRKYVKRERRKPLPEGFGVWDFDCKVGPDQASAAIKPLKEITDAIDGVAGAGHSDVYVEVLAVAGHRAGNETDRNIP